jgi:hypothetical protein
MVTHIRLRALVHDAGRPTWKTVDLGDPRLRSETVLRWIKDATPEQMLRLIKAAKAYRWDPDDH